MKNFPVFFGLCTGLKTLICDNEIEVRQGGIDIFRRGGGEGDSKGGPKIKYYMYQRKGVWFILREIGCGCSFME